MRPSHTYDRTAVPYYGGWTVVERMRQGKDVIVHGDGTSLWTLTHSDDFARVSFHCSATPEPLGRHSRSLRRRADLESDHRGRGKRLAPSRGSFT